jgi:anti-sigma-K factor RskA
MNELKDYLFGELTGEEKRRVEERLAADADYRLEFERLQLTQTALLAAPEPELPRRIAFVSDPVFEKPTFWQRLLAPAWAYACAAMLSCAILAHGYLSRDAAAGLDEVAVNARIEKAVAAVRNESEKRHEHMVKAMEETVRYMQERTLRVERAGYVEARQ